MNEKKLYFMIRASYRLFLYSQVLVPCACRLHFLVPSQIQRKPLKQIKKMSHVFLTSQPELTKQMIKYENSLGSKIPSTFY